MLLALDLQPSTLYKINENCLPDEPDNNKPAPGDEIEVLGVKGCVVMKTLDDDKPFEFIVDMWGMYELESIEQSVIFMKTCVKLFKAIRITEFKLRDTLLEGEVKSKI